MTDSFDFEQAALEGFDLFLTDRDGKQILEIQRIDDHGKFVNDDEARAYVYHNPLAARYVIQRLLKDINEQEPAPPPMTTRPPTEEELRIVKLILKRKALRENYQQARKAHYDADQELRNAVGVWDDMDDRSIPDGTGESWIIKLCGSELMTRYTKGMRLIEDEEVEF